MVRINFKRLDCEDFLIIYKTYVRPHLEYAMPFTMTLHTPRKIYSVWKASNGLRLDSYLASRNFLTTKDYVQPNGGARVFAARGKRLCCRSPPPSGVFRNLKRYISGVHFQQFSNFSIFFHSKYQYIFSHP